MASDSTESSRLHPSLVLGAFGEALVAGKRVAVLGDSATGLAERLAAASGRSVHAYDPDPQRTAASMAAAPRRGDAAVSYAVLDQALDLPAEAFDVVVVPDLITFANPKRVLAQARGMLTRRGVAIVASPNPEAPGGVAGRSGQGALSYYELYDVLSESFGAVRVFGLAPFMGQTIADFAAEGEPAVTIDSSLVERTEEPRTYVLLASDRPVPADPYTLVQVPVRDGLAWLGAAPATAEVDAAVLAEAQLRETVLRNELEELGERQGRDAQLAAERQTRATQLAARVAELDVMVEQLRAEATGARSKAATLERQLHQQRADSGQVTNRTAELEELLKEQRAKAADAANRAAELEVLVEEERAKAADAANRAAELERLVKEQRAKAADASTRAVALESRLGKRDHRVGVLEAQVAEAAERQAELEDALATIAEREAELEQELADAQQRQAEAVAKPLAQDEVSPAAETPQQVRAYEFQLDELKRTLAATRNERDAYRDQAAEAARLRTELSEQARARAEAEQRYHQVADGVGDQDLADAHDQEIGRLEAALRERGEWGTGLQNQLREAQRVGRELVRRLEREQLPAAARVASPSPDAAEAAPSSGPVDDVTEAEPPATSESADRSTDLRAQLEVLAQQCSSYRADLESAQWTIAGLEHRLSSCDAPDDTPELRKIEEALRAAQTEIAQLRGQLRQGEREGA